MGVTVDEDAGASADVVVTVDEDAGASTDVDDDDAGASTDVVVTVDESKGASKDVGVTGKVAEFKMKGICVMALVIGCFPSSDGVPPV